MLLDDLYQAIEKLRERMENHQDKLKQSEALTRNALVDPLLRALGWDTEDPAQVMPEYRMDNNLIADYALLSNGKTAIVVEAKSLNTSVDDTRPDGIVDKGIRYCMRDGIEYYVTTDGRKWNIYETHRPVPIAEKKIVSFDIADSPGQRVPGCPGPVASQCAERRRPQGANAAVGTAARAADYGQPAVASPRSCGGHANSNSHCRERGQLATAVRQFQA